MPDADAEPLDAYHWLVSAAATPYLLQAQQVTSKQSVQLAAELRQELSPIRTRLVLEQARLRQRAAAKFNDGSAMFLTQVGLEQATDEAIARYKAARFPHDASLADLCCGIGGDLLALARVSRLVRGIDRDPIPALLAAANARQSHLQERVELRCAAVSAVQLSGIDAWHIDPDRRPRGKRTSQPDLSDPDLATLDTLLAACAEAAIKLAPAADVPDHWGASCEREWISRGGECRQQVAWFGKLAGQVAARSATRVDSDGEPLARWGPATGFEPPETCQAIGKFVYEPDPAILAATLTGSIARSFGLAALAPDVVYLTSRADSQDDHPIASALLSAFRVIEVLPLDTRRLKAALRARDIGRLEVKKRIVRVDPRELISKLSLRGAGEATLLLTPYLGKQRAILAQRMNP